MFHCVDDGGGDDDEDEDEDGSSSGVYFSPGVLLYFTKLERLTGSARIDTERA